MIQAILQFNFDLNFIDNSQNIYQNKINFSNDNRVFNNVFSIFVITIRL